MVQSSRFVLPTVFCASEIATTSAWRVTSRSRATQFVLSATTSPLRTMTAPYGYSPCSADLIARVKAAPHHPLVDGARVRSVHARYFCRQTRGLSFVGSRILNEKKRTLVTEVFSLPCIKSNRRFIRPSID